MLEIRLENFFRHKRHYRRIEFHNIEKHGRNCFFAGFFRFRVLTEEAVFHKLDIIVRKLRPEKSVDFFFGFRIGIIFKSFGCFRDGFVQLINDPRIRRFNRIRYLSAIPLFSRSSP